MKSPHEVVTDPKRLAALATYNAIDTPPEFEQDTLTEIAAAICGFPVALISLMDERSAPFASSIPSRAAASR